MHFRTFSFAFLMSAAHALVGQQWLAPGACWVYQNNNLGPQRHHYWYDIDSVVDGHNVQVVRRTQQYVLPGGQLGTVETWPDWYYRMEGGAVMRRCGGLGCWTTAWDTLYYLGVPGDRWSSEFAEPWCYPHGVLEITDTGRVMIAGVVRRTWDLAYLDENGQFVPDLPSWLGDTLGIIERIGSPLGNPPQPCDGGVIDYFFFHLLHYSDIEVNIPEGTACDGPTGLDSHVRTHLSLLPNPGTDHFQLSGFGSSSAQVSVRDALGRNCFSTGNYRSGERIRAESWAPGSYYITVISATQSRTLQWLKH